MIEIIDTLGQKNNGDFPLVDSNAIRGGYYQVENLQERDSIPPKRRKEGMFCYVKNDKIYQLVGGIENSNWLEFKSSGVDKVYVEGAIEPENKDLLWIDDSDEMLEIVDRQVLDEISMVLQDHLKKINELNLKIDISIGSISIHDHANMSSLDTVTNRKIIEWNNKSDFSGNYNELINKPTIPTKTSELTNDSVFATEEFVNQKVGEGGTNVDLSLYATKEDLKNKSDIVHGHSYNDLTDKPIIPTVDVDKAYVDVQYGLASTALDSHINNHPVGESYDDTEIRELVLANQQWIGGLENGKANKSDLHEHSNKEVLDSVSATKINEWNNKSTFNGDYNSLLNKPTIPTSLPANGGNSSTVSGIGIWVGTRTEYNAIANKNTNTLYFVKK